MTTDATHAALGFGLQPFEVHSLFDALAWLAGAATAWALRRAGWITFPVPSSRRTGYYLSLAAGAAIGGYLFGTLNLWVCGLPGVGRSIEGALAGAVAGVEIYKRWTGLKMRTGAAFAAPLAVAIAVGRIGCHLAGLDDFTYGAPTSLPWAVDYGDGVPRHPAALYESASMALFAAAYLLELRRGDARLARNGLYVFLVFYGAQRFLWEFVKPYSAVAGPFTIFHILSLALIAYGLAMLATQETTNDARPLAA